ncbi:NAD-dependent succinate-semialdehyde dehydrogenase [Sulfitobacter sp. NFXS29]|uniref:NAD-dependent succinate-semialdehyde dehydrogenase n=1 Tax=Sulfitobacter sp. NFXS29 TaxID=2818438 RepID=UPI0032DE739E
MEKSAQMFIAGEWCDGQNGSAEVVDPATGETVGAVALAGTSDLNLALDAADAAFKVWSLTSAFERSGLLRKAAGLLRERAEEIGRLMVREQGKPLAEAKGEVIGSADHIDWAAEEGRRMYGRVIPARAPNVQQIAYRLPLGVVAGFSPWNFPISQAVRKIAGALGVGCTIIIKCPEETPYSCAELVRCFEDAGIPRGVVNLVYGVPKEVSEYLIPADPVRMVTFTGSIPVGKTLGEIAARYVKRCTLELGGHSPFVVAEDADVDAAVQLAATLKFRNAGQVCAAPSRFYIHDTHYERFLDGFVAASKELKVGSGFEVGVQMGPLANARRLDAMEVFVADAVDRGAKIATGGRRIGNKGNFFEPTVLTDIPEDASLMVDEPFGPIAPVLPFSSLESAIEKANALPYALAAFAFGTSQKTVDQLSKGLEAGMVSINHFGIASPETPFGGMKESGYGSEGGVEGMDAFVTTKFISTLV